MNRGTLGIAVAAAVAASAILAWWLLGTAGPAPTPAPASAPPAAKRPGGASAASSGSGASSAAEDAPASPPAAKGIPITGRVVDFARRPVAGARIEAHPWSLSSAPRDIAGFTRLLFEYRPKRAGATSRADGTFTLETLGPGRWVLIASAAGHSPGRTPELFLQEGAAAPFAEILLGRACRLVVRVVDSAGGPIPGIEVAATPPPRYPDPFLNLPFQARTDAGGAVTFDSLPEGQVAVVAHLPGPRFLGRMDMLPGIEELTLRVEGTASLLLRVRDTAGAPVEGASVEAHLEFPGENAGVLLTGTTGAEGTMRWERLPESAVEKVAAEKPGFAPTERDAEQGEGVISGSAVLEMELVLGPGAVVAGVVRRRPGDDPVPGARVTLLLPDAPETARERDATSDASGVFRFEGVPEGRGLLFARGEGVSSPGLGGIPLHGDGSASQESGPSLAVPSGPAELRRDVYVEATGRIAGRIASSSGSPVAGAVARIRPAAGKDVPDQARFLPSPVLADAEGRFEFPAVAAGASWIVNASAPGHLSAESPPIPVAAGAEAPAMEIRLGEGGAVVGRVTGAAGEPIPGARLSAAVRPRPPVVESIEASSDAEGNYRLHPVPPGTVTVTVNAEEFVPLSRSDVAVASGLESKADFSLAPALAISGTVREAEGRPVEGARIHASPAGSGASSRRAMSSAVSDARGRFRIGGLAPGSYDVSVQSALHPGAALPGVAAGGAEIRIDLPPGVSIAGRVVDALGNSIAGARVLAQRPGVGGPQARGRSGADGKFTIHGLLAGDYSVVATVDDGNFLRAEAKGVPGGSDGLLLRMERAFTIRGRVLGVDGAPAKGRPRVQALDRSGNQVESTRADGTGAFELNELPDGEFTLRVSGADRQEGSVSAVAGAEGVEIRLVAK